MSIICGPWWKLNFLLALYRGVVGPWHVPQRLISWDEVLNSVILGGDAIVKGISSQDLRVGGGKGYDSKVLGFHCTARWLQMSAMCYSVSKTRRNNFRCSHYKVWLNVYRDRKFTVTWAEYNICIYWNMTWSSINAHGITHAKTKTFLNQQIKVKLPDKDLKQTFYMLW